MHTRVRKIYSIAAMFFLVLGLVGSTRAQFAGDSPWQVGDIVVCFGNGTCNVLRNTSFNGLVLLDQISDAAPPNSPGVTNPGDTRGTAINNTLHLFTSDAGAGDNQSKMVEYSIASVDPFTGLPVTHTPVRVFDGSVANGSEGIQAIALDLHGNIFVGNNNPSTIVELNDNFNQSGVSQGFFSIPQVTAPAWQAGFQYFTAGANILDPNGHVQQVLTPGTSRTPLFPPFNQFGGITNDNAVVWTDQGQKVWQAKTAYPVNAVVIDPASHRQIVITAGTSGTNQPSWNDSGGTTRDSSVVWQDRGSIAWQFNHSYAVGQFAAGPAGASAHLQQVTTAGTSGPAQPSWNTNGGTTPDGLQWTDTGSAVGKPCVENQLDSLDLNSDASAVYFTSGPGGIIQKVTTTPLSSGNCTVFADFGPNVTLHGIRVVPPNSMPTSCKSSSCPNTNGGILVVATGTQFVDTDNDLPGIAGNGTGDATEFSSGQEIFDVCTGASLSAVAAPPGPGVTDSCALLLDASTGLIVARYPVPGVSTLQALTLDPLVSDCTGNNCLVAVPPPTVSNFWLGDSATANFYSVDFATGTPSSAFDANANMSAVCPTPACSTVNGIQALGIYGGEGANQPDLTKLFSSPPDLTSAANSNTQVVQFPLPVTLANTNTLTVTLYGPTSTPATPLALYASLIDEITCFTDQTPPAACTQTTSDPSKGIVWKVDIPLANNSAGATALPFTEDLALEFQSPVAGQSIFTHVALDAFYDTTASVGALSKFPSTQMLFNELNPSGGQEVNAVCTYGSPLAPSDTLPAQCLGSNPNTINFKFTCSNFSQPLSQYAGGNPNLIIVQAPFPLPSPPPAFNALCQTNTLEPCKLSGTGGTTNFRIGSGQWHFSWNSAGQGTYRACTFDPTKVDQPFCTNFIVPGTAKCP